MFIRNVAPRWDRGATPSGVALEDTIAAILAGSAAVAWSIHMTVFTMLVRMTSSLSMDETGAR